MSCDETDMWAGLNDQIDEDDIEELRLKWTEKSTKYAVQAYDILRGRSSILKTEVAMCLKCDDEGETATVWFVTSGSVLATRLDGLLKNIEKSEYITLQVEDGCLIGSLTYNSDRSKDNFDYRRMLLQYVAGGPEAFWGDAWGSLTETEQSTFIEDIERMLSTNYGECIDRSRLFNLILEDISQNNEAKEDLRELYEEVLSVAEANACDEEYDYSWVLDDGIQKKLELYYNCLGLTMCAGGCGLRDFEVRPLHGRIIVTFYLDGDFMTNRCEEAFEKILKLSSEFRVAIDDKNDGDGMAISVGIDSISIMNSK